VFGPCHELQQFACLDESTVLVQEAGKMSGVVLPGMLLLQTVHALLHLCHTLLQPEALTMQLVRHLWFIHLCQAELVHSVTALLLAHAQLALQAYEPVLNKLENLLYEFMQAQSQAQSSKSKLSMSKEAKGCMCPEARPCCHKEYSSNATS